MLVPMLVRFHPFLCTRSNSVTRMRTSASRQHLEANSIPFFPRLHTTVTTFFLSLMLARTNPHVIVRRVCAPSTEWAWRPHLLVRHCTALFTSPSPPRLDIVSHSPRFASFSLPKSRRPTRLACAASNRGCLHRPSRTLAHAPHLRVGLDFVILYIVRSPPFSSPSSYSHPPCSCQ
jgi:hypothetical protein